MSASAVDHACGSHNVANESGNLVTGPTTEDGISDNRVKTLLIKHCGDSIS